MVDLQELFQAARVAADDQGQPVVQIPLKVWEDWSGIEYDHPPDELRVVLSLDFCGGYFIILYQNRLIAGSLYLPASHDLEAKVIEYLKTERKLLIGERTAEHMLRDIGSVFFSPEEEQTRNVRGRTLIDGLPAEIVISSAEVRQVIWSTVDSYVRYITLRLEMAFPEEMKAMTPDRIVLKGVFGRLKGLDRLLQEATGVPVVVK